MIAALKAIGWAVLVICILIFAIGLVAVRDMLRRMDNDPEGY